MKTLTIFLLVVGLVLLVSVSASADTIYVKSGSSGDGSSWANAYGLLQVGLDDASYGDEIWVAAGTYKPTKKVGGTYDQNKTFQMVNGVGIYGGFPSTGNPAWLDRDPNTHETILSGDIGVPDEPSDNCYHVFYHPQETNLDPNAVLDGFTITDGNASASFPHSAGGGMHNWASSPTVTNCIFKGNFTRVWGGGMYNDNSSPIVKNCTFSDNHEGMFNYQGNPMITYCTFFDNSAYWGGGGLFNNESSPTVTHCRFLGNEASYEGGGMVNYSGNETLICCIFSGNTSLSITGDGGGIYNNRGTTIMKNCTFAGNTAEHGSGMYVDESHTTVMNCIFWDGDEGIFDYDGIITISHSNVQGGNPGTGNIDADPMFKDPNGPDNILGTEDDNLQLAYNSPCIDAGDNTAVPADTTDLDGDGNTTERIPLDLTGHARFTDDPLTVDTGVPDPPDYPNVVDMGAYERYEFCGDLIQALKGDLNLDCYIDLLDFAIMARHWLKYIGPE